MHKRDQQYRFFTRFYSVRPFYHRRRYRLQPSKARNLRIEGYSTVHRKHQRKDGCISLHKIVSCLADFFSKLIFTVVFIF